MRNAETSSFGVTLRHEALPALRGCKVWRKGSWAAQILQATRYFVGFLCACCLFLRLRRWANQNRCLEGCGLRSSAMLGRMERRTCANALRGTGLRRASRTLEGSGMCDQGTAGRQAVWRSPQVTSQTIWWVKRVHAAGRR